MATVPTLEAHLIQLYECLGLPQSNLLRKTEVRDAYSDLGLSLEKQDKVTKEVLDAVLHALGVEDGESMDYAFHHFMYWISNFTTLQRQLFTRRASSEEIIWHLAARVHAPSLGRYLAFWAGDDALGQGMPSGQFWFLPTIDISSNKLTMPVPKVIDWLLDLCQTSVNGLVEQINEVSPVNAFDDHVGGWSRNLFNWKRKELPQIASVNEIFTDAIDAHPAMFKGAFRCDEELPIADQIAAVKDFVHRRGLSAESLRREIPMTHEGDIEAVLAGTADEAHQRLFVQLLNVRYQVPTARVIRQRFAVARMCQAVYRKLFDFLTPGDDELCSDPRRNKAYQLVCILQRSFNLTIEARNACGHLGQFAEDQYFESRLTPVEVHGAFQGVLPSQSEAASKGVVRSLNWIFELAQGDLQDYFPTDLEHGVQIGARMILDMRGHVELIKAAEQLRTKLLRGSPSRALELESNFNVLSHAVLDKKLPLRTRMLASQRSLTVAKQYDEPMRARLDRLHLLLDCQVGVQGAGVEQEVSALIEACCKDGELPAWKAMVEQFEGKHCLAKGDFPGAEAKFRAALSSCSEFSYGPLRGMVARDLWAVLMARSRLIQGSHEICYRNMRAFGMFEDALPRMEDAAVEVADYFWMNLYKPYPGHEIQRKTVAKNWDEILAMAMGCLKSGDVDHFETWLRTKSKGFRSAKVKDVRGDTWLTPFHYTQLRLSFASL